MGLTSLRSLETPFYKGLEASEVECFNLTQTSLKPHLNLTSTSCSLEWNHLIVGHMTTIGTLETKCPHSLAQIHLCAVSSLD